MNFKEAYKSANDKIHGDKRLLADILDGKSNKKHISFRPIYTYAGAAVAAAFVITAVVISPELLSGRKDTEQKLPDIIVQSESEKEGAFVNSSDRGDGEDTPSTPPAQLQPSEEKTVPPSAGEERNKSKMQTQPTEKLPENKSASHKSIPEHTNRPVQTDAPVQHSQNDTVEGKVQTHEAVIEDAAEAMPTIEESKPTAMAETAEKSVITDIRVNEIQPRNESRASGGGGGAAIAGAKRIAEASEFEDMNADEYFSYISVNINNSVIIPDDMSINIPETITVEKQVQTGEIKSDLASFYAESAENSQRYINITTTRVGGSIKDELENSNYEKSTIGECGAIITHKDENYNAVMNKNGTYISVNAGSISEAELTALLISMTE